MAINTKKKIRKKINRNFLAKDYDAIKSDLLRNARIFFPDKIQDFSEPSVGGLLLDMAASIGDSLSFYLDHCFSEMDPTRAVEEDNIRMHLANAGMQPPGAAPSSVILTVTIVVPAEKINHEYFPKFSALPVILEGTVFSGAGINFTVTEDIDFAKKDPQGFFIAKYSVRTTGANGVPVDFDVSMDVLTVSGTQTTEEFSFGDHLPFPEITLSQPNVSTILSVTDSEGEEYYQVESLSQDNVFISVDNRTDDYDQVSSNLEMIPAPRRFVTETSVSQRTTTIKFGSGDAEVDDDDILPDPSEVAFELFGKKSFQRFSIDPNDLLRTQTLGIAPSNTIVTVRYRHGGGSEHNVPEGVITELTSLEIEFRNSPSADDALAIRRSIRSSNRLSSKGGAPPPDIGNLRDMVINARNSQMRTVTREDLLARIYTLPSRFGRVFRAAIEPNPSNPLSSILYICSLNSEGTIDVAPDSLKLNLSRYLNEFRLITDAVDILDVSVVNFGVAYEVVIAKHVDRLQVIKSINTELAEAFDRRYFQIGQPIIFDDISNIIINHNHVISLANLRVFPKTGISDGRTYSEYSFPFNESVKNGILSVRPGSIFEMRFPNFDISGTAL